VLVSGLPKAARQDTIKAHFEQWGDVHEVTMSLVGDSKIFSAMHVNGATSKKERGKLRRALTDRLGKAGKEPSVSRANVAEETHKEKLAAEMLQLAQNPDRDCSGFAVVSFEKSDTKLICISDHSHWTPFFACLHRREAKDPDFGKFEGERLDVVQAPSADEIHWENYEYSLWSRVRRNIATSLSLSVLMILCSSLLVGVQIANKWTPEGSSLGVTIGSTIGTIVANVTIFAVAPPIVAKFEKHHYSSHQENSLLLKILAFQLVNSIAISMCFLFASQTKNLDHGWYDTGSFVVLMTMAGDLVAIGMFVEVTEHTFHQ
jgi:hypothetical protein